MLLLIELEPILLECKKERVPCCIIATIPVAGSYATPTGVRISYCNKQYRVYMTCLVLLIQIMYWPTTQNYSTCTSNYYMYNVLVQGIEA